ncbi:putative rhamnosyl transferase [Halomonas qaidamensis]|uniref:Rhamnosyl transferase n=1 Tax=Halomonas qaidamensis TaxID=2866211 RepID=A0ABY6JLB6_9GAMM|nr:putative rhamnosyl transferase [Halomonas qaidamensis]UYV18036.1 putative rhamnosyl transferase [Halomonas qaidamensis]
MKRHVFVLVRYSVLTHHRGAWVIGRDNDFDEYKKKLFEDERLKLHTKLFKTVTLPSLLKMEKKNTTVLLFTSSEMPAKYLNEIKEIELKFENFKVIEVDVSQSLTKVMQDKLLGELGKLGEEVCYASVRLDDDDALADEFYVSLFKYVDPSFVGHSISFSKGYAGLYENGSYKGFYVQNYPKLALGLSHIHHYRKGEEKEVSSIYSLGGHTRIDEKAPIIIDSRKSMYIRTIHEASDMYGSKIKSKVELERNKVTHEEVFEKFWFLNKKEILNKVLVSGKAFVKTHHNTFLCFSKKSDTVFHYDFQKIEKSSDLFFILYDMMAGKLCINNVDGWLEIKKKGKVRFVNVPDLEVLLNKESGIILKMQFDEMHGGAFLSASRSGTVRFVEHCKAWENFLLTF